MRSVSSNMMNEVYHLSLKVEVVEEVGKYDCYEGQRSKVSIMIQYVQQEFVQSTFLGSKYTPRYRPVQVGHTHTSFFVSHFLSLNVMASIYISL